MAQSWLGLASLLRSGSGEQDSQQQRRPGTSIAEFWQISRYDSGQIVARAQRPDHRIRAFLGLDLQHRKAVVVCSDVACVTDNLGNQLLT